jgi:hypothetical protein
MPDFAVISGLYDNSLSGNTEGYFYYLGNIYYVPAGTVFTGGPRYLVPGTTDDYEVLASDGNYYKVFRTYQATADTVQYGTIPAFDTTSLDAYRLNLSYLNAANILTGTVPVARLPQITIEIGDWNMNTTASITIPLTSFGLEDSSAGANKIMGIDVIIRSDDNYYVNPLNYLDSSAYAAHGTYLVSYDGMSGWNLHLHRKSGGNFDTTNYEDTSYNRGYVTLRLTD